MREVHFNRWIEYEPDRSEEKRAFVAAYVCSDYARVAFSDGQTQIYVDPPSLRAMSNLYREMATKMEHLTLSALIDPDAHDDPPGT